MTPDVNAENERLYLAWVRTNLATLEDGGATRLGARPRTLNSERVDTENRRPPTYAVESR